MLRRIAEITTELQGARTELRNLAARDTAAGAIVIRTAHLSQERARLERSLYEQGLERPDDHSQLNRGQR